MSKSVLIAEDNLVMRNLIKYYLKGFKEITIFEAKDGIEALTIIKNNSIDILFLDWNMPNLDGLNVVNYLKKSKKELNIVSISGDNDHHKKLVLKNLGIKYFLTKPLDPKLFKEIVNKLLA